MFGSVYCKPINLLFISLLTLPQLALSAETGGEPATKNQFITLGTAGGPEAELDRAQPANALIVGTDVYLVDAGDGARPLVGLLAAIGQHPPHDAAPHLIGVLNVALGVAAERRDALDIHAVALGGVSKD